MMSEVTQKKNLKESENTIKVSIFNLVIDPFKDFL